MADFDLWSHESLSQFAIEMMAQNHELRGIIGELCTEIDSLGDLYIFHPDRQEVYQRARKEAR